MTWKYFRSDSTLEQHQSSLNLSTIFWLLNKQFPIERTGWEKKKKMWKNEYFHNIRSIHFPDIFLCNRRPSHENSNKKILKPYTPASQATSYMVSYISYEANLLNNCYSWLFMLSLEHWIGIDDDGAHFSCSVLKYSLMAFICDWEICVGKREKCNVQCMTKLRVIGVVILSWNLNLEFELHFVGEVPFK